MKKALTGQKEKKDQREERRNKDGENMGHRHEMKYSL
jgi:hypothetical protein